jgi:phosphocarrier protein FPr
VVGLVIVSHSAALAEGVSELAREMGGEEVAIEAAGGLDDGAIGTDAARVMAAVERVRSPDGVLILMDLGSALMSAEMAVEMLGPDGGPIALSAAPLVEGAVAAAARARGGATLDEVAGEARGALAMKSAQLSDDEAPATQGSAGAASASEAAADAGGAASASEAAADAGAAAAAVDARTMRLQITNRLGLHARPAARFVSTASGFDARVVVRNESRGTGPADARSLTALAALGVRQGDEIAVEASGPQAQEALDALHALADENFGDPPDDEAAPRGEPGAVAAPDSAAARGEPGAVAAPDSAAARREPGAVAAPDAPGAAASAAAAGTSAAAPEAVAPPAGASAAADAAAAAPAPGTRLHGAAASVGIAIGPARRLVAPEPEVADAPAGTPAQERAALDAARAAVREDLATARATLSARGSAAEAAIFEAHALMLDDTAVTEPAYRRIDDGTSAGRAWQAAAADAADTLRALDDPYLRERAVDVDDVSRRVLARLAGAPATVAPSAPGIIVADELTPGEAAALDPASAWGIVTARGGATGHAAIVARALGVPAVVGAGAAVLAIPDGTPLAADGAAGTVDVDPDPATLRELEARRDAAAAERAAALARAAEPGALADGRRVEVFANVGSAAEARSAAGQGAEGVGLLRTEFLFLDRATPPDEEEQVAVLREIAAALDGRPVVVRTLDAGADKPLPFLRQEPEDNPFLGVRGIRLSLAQPELFKTQLRAILRVAAEHPIKVMFPMVATLDELRAARALLDELGAGPQLEVGVMVEVPALALQAGEFAPEVDFFSIGTNDLAQYTMAAERGNAALAGLLEDARAPVLALIASVVAAAGAHGRWVGVCGELAGDPEAAVQLAGLGVRELSMAASRIPAVKAALRAVDSQGARAAAEAALPPGSAPPGAR